MADIKDAGIQYDDFVDITDKVCPLTLMSLMTGRCLLFA